MKARLQAQGCKLSGPRTVKEYLKLKLAELKVETFGILLLDAQNCLIKDATLFIGSIAHCSIYPREIVKESLMNHAISVVIYHNHPSGNEGPSSEDMRCTKKIKAALELIDVRLVDHIIIGGFKTFSFVEEGLLND
jgi:DNA repair protein RadC